MNRHEVSKRAAGEGSREVQMAVPDFSVTDPEGSKDLGRHADGSHSTGIYQQIKKKSKMEPIAPGSDDTRSLPGELSWVAGNSTISFGALGNKGCGTARLTHAATATVALPNTQFDSSRWKARPLDQALIFP